MHWRQIDINDELFTYEYLTREDVCRLCWSRNATINIFTNSTETECNDILIDVLENNLQIKVDTRHSKNLCDNCFNEIERIYDFKTFCQKTANKLKNILQNQLITDIKSKIIEDDNSEESKNCVINDYFYSSDSDGIEEEKPVENVMKRVRRKTYYKPTYCRTCKIDLIDLNNLSDHNSKCHGIENNGTLFKCFGCEKSFRTRNKRYAHETHACIGLKNGFKCDICDRYIHTRKAFEKHMRDHRLNLKIELPEDLFKCHKCKKSFNTMIMVKNHFQEVHVNKTYICEECGKIYSRRDYLYKHKLIHAGIKRYQCTFCDYRATQKCTLNLHLRRHTGERPFTCDICSRQCVSSSNLRAHRKRHMGDKRYQCDVCSKTFACKIRLEKHITSAHDRCESHACEHCGATFKQLSGLKRHLAAKHRKLSPTNVNNVEEITKK